MCYFSINLYRLTLKFLIKRHFWQVNLMSFVPVTMQLSLYFFCMFVYWKHTGCLLLFMCFHVIILLSTWWHCFILIYAFVTYIMNRLSNASRHECQLRTGEFLAFHQQATRAQALHQKSVSIFDTFLILSEIKTAAIAVSFTSCMRN